MEGADKTLRFCSWAPEVLLRDRKIRLLGAAPFGALASLLLEQWYAEEGGLPCDGDELRLLARMTPEEWAKHSKTVLSFFEVGEDELLRSAIVEGPRKRAEARRASAKAAVEARESYRKVEPKSSSNDKQPIEDRSSKVKVKEKVKEKVNSYTAEFEEFWTAYKSLGGGSAHVKADSLKSWQKALSSAPPEVIIAGVEAYAQFLKEKEKTKPDAREYVPMPTTWLNQKRWTAEYPTAPKGSKPPKEDVDYYSVTCEDDEGRQGIRYLKIEAGVKTEKPFSFKEWGR